MGRVAMLFGGVLAVSMLAGCDGGKVSYGRPEEFGLDLTPLKAAPGGEALSAPPEDVEGAIRRLRESKTTVVTPMRLAVSEGASASPRESLMQALVTQDALFSKVMPLPATGEEKGGVSRVDRARLLAASLGATHLLLVEGQTETGTSATPLTFLDITIVGAYLIPSNGVGTKVRLGGALVEVDSGRVLAYVTTQEERTTLVPSAMAGGGGCLDMRRSDYPEKYREETVDLAMGKLGTALAARVRELAAPISP